MLMNYLKLIIGINTLLFFSSCDKTIISDYTIQNNTDSEITIYHSSTRCDTINSMESFLLESITDIEIDTPFESDTVIIKKNDGSIITYLCQEKNTQDRNIFNLADNWDKVIVSESRNKSHYELIYTITEDDFVSNDE